MNKLVLLVLGISSLCSVQAAPPSPPLVALPPAGTTWNVTLEYPDAKKDKPKDAVPPSRGQALPVQLTVAAGYNGISKGEITYDDKTKETFYIAAGFLFVKASNTGAIFAVSPEDSDLRSLKTAGFPATKWITLAYFVGTAKLNEQPCAHYIYDIPEGNPELPAGKMEAFIQEGTRFPVQIAFNSDTKLIMTFSQPAPFNQEITLPRELQDILDKRRAQSSALDQIRRINQAQRH